MRRQSRLLVIRTITVAGYIFSSKICRNDPWRAIRAGVRSRPGLWEGWRPGRSDRFVPAGLRRSGADRFARQAASDRRDRIQPRWRSRAAGPVAATAPLGSAKTATPAATDQPLRGSYTRLCSGLMPIVYLDAVLEPPRSLSHRGLNRVMMILGGASLLSGLGFVMMGAWPVAGFMGLEILALWLVFRWSFRSQTARTYVRVTADAVVLRRVDARGREARASLASYFARVEYDPTASGAHALRLTTSRAAYPLGEHLNARERETFARRLSQALDEARRERYAAVGLSEG